MLGMRKLLTRSPANDLERARVRYAVLSFGEFR